ncbi:unnamed protein product, partial [Rotaria sp. Silwood2]
FKKTTIKKCWGNNDMDSNDDVDHDYENTSEAANAAVEDQYYN